MTDSAESLDAEAIEEQSLDCDHCGGAAITSATGLFGDGDGERCASCGFPGHVSVDDADFDDVTAYWRMSDDEDAKCLDGDCEGCHPPPAEREGA